MSSATSKGSSAQMAALNSIVLTRMTKLIGWLERPARFIDRSLGPGLSMFVEGFAVRVIATVSLLISLAMPLMEVIPFSAIGAGA